MSSNAQTTDKPVIQPRGYFEGTAGDDSLRGTEKMM